MNQTLRIGRIFGIEVGVNWSVLLIFALIWGTLAFSELPLSRPGQSLTVYVGAGAIAALLFFISLLAHELGHAVLARRNGIGVQGITLWLLGGVSKLAGEPDDPATEVRISGVGPLISLLLGGFFFAVAQLGADAGIPGIAIDVLGWLGAINIMLGIFNFLPAAPLDGGRLLRAVVWKLTGDRFRGTVVSSRVGQVFGVAMIGLGIVAAFTLYGLSGLWLSLVGAFLVVSARGEERQARVLRVLATMYAGQIMRPTHPLRSTMTVAQVLMGLDDQRTEQGWPVVDDQDSLTGLLTLDRLLAVDPQYRSSTTLSQLARSLAPTLKVSPQSGLDGLMGLLSDTPQQWALVEVAGRPVGVIGPSDMARAWQMAQLRSTYR